MSETLLLGIPAAALHGARHPEIATLLAVWRDSVRNRLPNYQAERAIHVAPP